MRKIYITFLCVFLWIVISSYADLNLINGPSSVDTLHYNTLIVFNSEIKITPLKNLNSTIITHNMKKLSLKFDIDDKKFISLEMLYNAYYDRKDSDGYINTNKIIPFGIDDKHFKSYCQKEMLDLYKEYHQKAILDF